MSEHGMKGFVRERRKLRTITTHGLDSEGESLRMDWRLALISVGLAF